MMSLRTMLTWIGLGPHTAAETAPFGGPVERPEPIAFAEILAASALLDCGGFAVEHLLRRREVDRDDAI
jgi:hypothetical protein